ncbi:MAG: hypothetical protein A2Z18_01840 [Armatimonadetes bacterium RBG_16_58_9]|nr:MAG: hypothetical protein A2Z18_01840 [Armatimonadetes bacterium RBG_16_58_9]
MSSNRMVVAASISPLADFAKKVGGDLVEVELLVPAGASPHTFQLTPQQMNTLSKASVLILNGVGLEFWADKAISAADNPNLKVVRTADGLDIIDDVDEEHGKGGNPHVWLSPVCAISQVKAIRDAFIEADPQHKYSYAANAAHFIGQLEQLDSEIRRQVESFSTNKFVAFHPAWVYLARDYGLVQAAVIEKSPGVEPSPSEASDVVRTVRKIEARAIFAEPQFSPKVAEVIAQESGARVLILDPLGKPDDYDYIKMMRANLKQMAEALR